MGDFVVWLVLGSFVVLLFCIYSLSSQLERCVRLAVDIITGNQRKILEQLQALNGSQQGARATSSNEFNVLRFDRRVIQRRATAKDWTAPTTERRQLAGRRRSDLPSGY